ncbi:COX15/CtaA family protein [Alicyclobacillus macrosporangiidus]|uniref:Cytochrome c oxidase assembly protein subunit 15 n=1 Tax=Alicyclobacillus macrosporangiidus TaxID=392015 RepID=A0A1I7F4X4_9BACL|nr:COX15/CtaA family protein [Alicyclobacillus macrosporangiidus]SFU31202.1 cytochrome c oxidase assembly protein subunit 15 [Alicyclobacillus macrosporangiidus]
MGEQANQPRTPGRLSLTCWLSWATLVAMFLGNTIGFTDAVTGSAMGCGSDWPLCNGQWIPSHWTMAMVIEYTHRVSILFTSVFLLPLAVLAGWRYGRRSEVRWLIGFTLGGVVAESVLGAMTVLFQNPPAVIAVHLGVAITSFVALFLLTLTIQRLDRAGGRPAVLTPLRPLAASRRLSRWSWFGLGYVYVAAYIGAYVASTGYGALFAGWPLPAERYSAVGAAFWVDLLHRMAALGFLVLAVWLYALARRERLRRPDLYRASMVVVALVLLQALSGALLVWTHVSTLAFLVHVTLVTGLFMTLGYMAMQVLPDPAAVQSQDPSTRWVRTGRQRAGA